MNHIPIEEKFRVGLLARLASTKGFSLSNMVIQETLEAPSIEVEEFMTLNNARG